MYLEIMKTKIVWWPSWFARETFDVLFLLNTYYKNNGSMAAILDCMMAAKDTKLKMCPVQFNC